MESGKDYIHTSAKLGFVDSKYYDDNRPDYTDEAVHTVKDLLQIPLDNDKPYTLLELGAGTGKFTCKIRPLLPKNVEYLATEPNETFLKTLHTKFPDLKTLQCAAQSLPIEPFVQGIIAAHSFHWFADRETLDEMYRVLEDNGNIVLIWNTKDRRVDWLDQIIRTFLEFATDEPIYYQFEWKNAIDNYKGFQLVDNKILPGQVFQGNIDFLLGHFSSLSTIQKLDAHKKELVQTEIRNILNTHPDTRNKTIIQLPLITEVFHYRKIRK